MAWYSLYKWFVKFRKLPFENQIKKYKSYLYSEWFNSLTDEEKNKINEQKKLKKEMEKRRINTALFTMMNIMSKIYK